MNQEKIWEAFQNSESLVGLGFRARKRFEFIANHIPDKSSVLNIGVGNGYLESILVKKGVDVSCLDPSSSAIDRIREHLKLGSKAQSGYSQNIPFPDSSFDYLIMSEVLEHLEDEIIKKTLLEIKRVLKDDGEFLGTVPADENIGTSIVVCPNCSENFHRWGHLQSFSRQRLQNTLSLGFSHVDVQRKLFTDWSQLNWKGKTLAALKSFQVLLNLKGSAQNLFFVAKA